MYFIISNLVEVKLPCIATSLAQSRNRTGFLMPASRVSKFRGQELMYL